MFEWKIPLFIPDFTDEDIEAVTKPVKEAWLTMGSITQSFEQEFSRITATKHAFAVSNGTAALHLALLALDIRPGDEVLVPSLTFVACANVITAVGATPVFVDIAGEDDLTISPDDIRRKITPKTRAILVVHYAGFPCQMEKILETAKEYQITVIEDCAHALVSSVNGTYCGGFGDIGCFSFFSNKNMTTGEGGMVITNNDSLAERLKLLRSHGMTTLTLDRHLGRAFSYDVVMAGLNYRIDEIRSSLGLSQLSRLQSNLILRKRVWNIYLEKLQEIDEIRIPFQDRSGEEIGYHIFPILAPCGKRDDLMKYLKEKGIQTSIHYPAIHKFTIYQALLSGKNPECPITEEACSREVTLPFYTTLREEDITWIAGVIKGFFGS